MQNDFQIVIMIRNEDNVKCAMIYYRNNHIASILKSDISYYIALHADGDDREKVIHAPLNEFYNAVETAKRKIQR